MSDIRVLIVAERCAPSVGGMETGLDSLTRRLVDAGVSATVVGTKMPRGEAGSNTPYRVVFGPNWRQVVRLIRWAQIVELHHFDYAWWLLTKLLRRRLVIVYHSHARVCPKGLAWNGREYCGFRTHWRICPGCLRRDYSWAAAVAKWLSLPVKQWLSSHADAVVNISRYAEGRYEVPRRISRTIVHSIDTDRFQPAADRARVPTEGGWARVVPGAARRTADPSRGYLLFVGRLIPEKGCQVLLRAMAECRRAGVAMPLVIVGDGPQRGQLERLARELGLDGTVDFRGRLTGDDVVRCLQHAYALVVPSIGPETSGRAAGEAMACGTPVVSSTAGGLEEMVGVAGLVYSALDHRALAEHLKAIVQDPELHDRLRRQGLDFVKRHYVMDRVVQEYLELYRSLAPQASDRLRTPRRLFVRGKASEVFEGGVT